MGLRSQIRAYRRKKKLTKLKHESETVFLKAIDAETVATRAGINAFEAHIETFNRSSPLLRRNIHRLEKGLCMPNRREVFASDFIIETVVLFARLNEQPEVDQAEKRWAQDVLQRYFDVVDKSDPRIAEAYAHWTNIPTVDSQSDSFSPYRMAQLSDYVGGSLSQLPNFESFEKLCRARRSIRWFENKPIPMEKLEAAISAALLAPSACNRQPFTFYCARSEQMISEISSLPLGTKGFGESLPCLIAVVGDLSAFAHPRDRHLIFIDAALASMQLMLGLTAQGLGSVPINWPDIPENHERLREILNLSKHQVPIMLIGAGIPKDECLIPYSAKRQVTEVMQIVD